MGICHSCCNGSIDAQAEKEPFHSSNYKYRLIRTYSFTNIQIDVWMKRMMQAVLHSRLAHIDSETMRHALSAIIPGHEGLLHDDSDRQVNASDRQENYWKCKKRI
eukprot:859647_1